MLAAAECSCLWHALFLYYKGWIEVEAFNLTAGIDSHHRLRAGFTNTSQIAGLLDSSYF